MPGYISLHRDIQKHWLYEEARIFSRYEAWLDILMRVNHAEGKVTHNGTVEVVLRGSTIWSMGDMEKHWGWSNKKVKRFLLCLVGDEMLSMKSTTKKTYLTVINYDKYQGSDVDKAPPMHHESTAEAFQKHTNNNELIITNKKNKKELKEYHENTVELTNHLIDLMQLNNPNVKIPANLDKWNDEMEKIERIDKYDYMQIRSVIDWCQQDSFWKGNILSAPKLREKIATLLMQMQRPKAGATGNGKLTGFAKLQQMGREAEQREASGHY